MTIMIDSDRLFRICDYLESANTRKNPSCYEDTIFKEGYVCAINAFRDSIKRDIFLGAAVEAIDARD